MRVREKHLLQHAGSELHRLTVLLLQHVHVKVIEEVVPVVIHPALVQLSNRREKVYFTSCKYL